MPLSLGVHLEPLEELLEVPGPPDDDSPADWAVVGVELGPAVSTDEVTPGTLEDLALPGILHITDLRGGSYGGEIKHDETYRTVGESPVNVDHVQAPEQPPELRIVMLPEL